MRLSAEEISLMVHATGFFSKTPFYRNYFCASVHSENDHRWQVLVEYEVAELLSKPTEDLPYNTYRVTEKGIKFLKDMR